MEKPVSSVYFYTFYLKAQEAIHISEVVSISEFGKECPDTCRWLETEGLSILINKISSKPHASMHLCHVLVYHMEESLFFHQEESVSGFLP